MVPTSHARYGGLVYLSLPSSLFKKTYDSSSFFENVSLSLSFSYRVVDDDVVVVVNNNNKQHVVHVSEV